jgi:hypothetical protein
MQIFRLPEKDGFSTRPLGTTRSLIIWVESYVASMIHHRLRPYREREWCTMYSLERGAGEVDPPGEEKWSCVVEGGKLESSR